MSHDTLHTLTHDDIRHEARIYVRVFIALLVLTLVTVTLSYAHLPSHIAIVLALLLAALKGSLVAGYFMHLRAEQVVVYATLIFAGLCVFGLLALPLLGQADQVHVR